MKIYEENLQTLTITAERLDETLTDVEKRCADKSHRQVELAGS
jgi:hypothetical protein